MSAELQTSVDEWAEFSMNPQPYEEIKKRALLDSYDGKNRVCYAYLSRFQAFTEEQLEEMMVITSPLYQMMSSLTEENIKIATSIIRITSAEKQVDHIRTLLDSGLISDKRFSINLELRCDQMEGKNSKIEDKMDWKEIGRRDDLSIEFKKKYSDLMKVIPGTFVRTKNQPLQERSIIYKKKKSNKKKKSI